MDLNEAWITLGQDPAKVLERIASREGREAKVEAAEAELKAARSVARRLMGVHHPDVNQGDQGATERFMRVQQALETVESHTVSFRERASRAPRQAAGVFIEIKK